MFRAGQYLYQMGYTLQEFARVLSGNFTREPSPWRLQTLADQQWLVLHVSQSFSVKIEVQRLAPRRIGLLELPVLEVRFNVEAGDRDLEQQFFESFSGYFHKGGG